MTPSAPAEPGAASVEPQHPRQPWIWRLLRVAVAVAVAAVLVVLALLHRDDVVSALEALRAPSPPWLVAAIAAEGASMGLYARMQRRLLRGAGTRVSLRRAVALAYAAHSMSITLPGGPLLSTVYNFRRMRAFGADSTVAAWATAASGVLSSLGLVVVTAAIGVAAATDDTDDLAALGAVVAGAVLVGCALAVLRRRPRWRGALGRRGDAVLARVPERYRHRVDRAVSWAGAVLRVRIPTRDLGMAGLHSVGNWVADGACLALCCLAVGVHVHPVGLALTYVAGMTASSMPIVPGGLGTVDAALTLGLIAAGAAPSSALAAVVLYRLISLVLIGGIGWVLWLVGRLQRRREDALGAG